MNGVLRIKKTGVVKDYRFFVKVPGKLPNSIPAVQVCDATVAKAKS